MTVLKEIRNKSVYATVTEPTYLLFETERPSVLMKAIKHSTESPEKLSGTVNV